MLALLFASLLFTATIVQQTYTQKNSLLQTGQTLEENLHKKEEFVNSVIGNKTSFEKLKTLPDDDKLALQTIKNFTTDQSIWLNTFVKNRLAFWSGFKVLEEDPRRIKEGYSFVQAKNGYYDVIKKSEGDFSVIAFIPVLINYPFQNQYLQNAFAKNLLNDDNIVMADFSDNIIYEIKSINGQYLFSVKNNPNHISHKFFYFEIVVWALCFIVLALLMHNCCNYIANRGYVYLSFVALAVFIILVRWLNLR